MSSPGVLEFGIVGVDTHAVMSGEEIKRARELAGLTQDGLARLIGVSSNSVSNWERGVSTPRGKEPLLRQALGIDSSRTVTEIDHGPPLRKASSAELLAELARRMESSRESAPVTELPTGRYRMRKTSGPSVRGQHADDQDETGSDRP